MLFDPFGYFRKMLILLADVILLTQVHKVHDWLGGQEEKWVDDFDLRSP